MSSMYVSHLYNILKVISILHSITFDTDWLNMYQIHTEQLYISYAQ